MERHKILPRLLFAVYIVLAAWSGIWFMGLEAPDQVDLGFVTLLWGAGGATVWKFWDRIAPKRGED